MIGLGSDKNMIPYYLEWVYLMLLHHFYGVKRKDVDENTLCICIFVAIHIQSLINFHPRSKSKLMGRRSDDVSIL